MAKVSITHHHDYMRFIVTFQDGRKAKGNFSRGGDTVKVEPEDLALVRAISQTFADDKARGRRDPDWNLMKTFEVVKRVGDEARTLEGFLAALDAELGNPQRTPLPQGPATTKATVRKQGRGWVVDCHFPSGEKYSCTVNGKSLGYEMTPEFTGLMETMTRTVFGCLAFMEPQDVAERLRDAALESRDVVDWIGNFRASVSPAPRR